MIKRQGNKWCVLHGHPKKKGSKTDKPIGSVIKCFEFDPGNKSSETRAKNKARKMHSAIMANK